MYFLIVIWIDPLFRTGENYYLEVFQKECKYVFKEKRMPEYITEDIEISFNDSDAENSDEENYDKKILMKKIRYRMLTMIHSYMLQKKDIKPNAIQVICI